MIERILQERKIRNLFRHKEDILLCIFEGPITGPEREELQKDYMIFQTNGLTGLKFKKIDRNIHINMSTEENPRECFREMDPEIHFEFTDKQTNRLRQHPAFKFISDSYNNANFEFIIFEQSKICDWHIGRESYEDYERRKKKEVSKLLSLASPPN